MIIKIIVGIAIFLFGVWFGYALGTAPVHDDWD